MVQVSEGGYTGMLNVSRKEMKLFFMRNPKAGAPAGSMEIVEVRFG
jgi:oligogalacturonide lyase